MPNEYGMIFDVDIVKKWAPTKLRFIGETVFFNCDDLCLSMNTEDFKNIFDNYETQKE